MRDLARSKYLGGVQQVEIHRDVEFALRNLLRELRDPRHAQEDRTRYLGVCADVLTGEAWDAEEAEAERLEAAKKNRHAGAVVVPFKDAARMVRAKEGT